MSLPSPISIVDVVHRTGFLDPRRLPALTTSITRWGPTAAAVYATGAFVTPNRPAVVDGAGRVSYSELHRRSSALAKGLRQLGLGADGRLGVACRNHADFVELTVAAAKIGAGVVYLNTGFARPQMTEVVRREDIAVLAVDDALLDLVDESIDTPVVVAATSAADRTSDFGTGRHTMEQVRSLGRFRLPLVATTPRPPVLLTSGTTGTPKGAQRSNRVDPVAALGIVERIPYRHDDVVAITSPLFHAWGLAQSTLASVLGATIVASEAFDPEEALATIERERVTVLVVVPVLLQRMLASPALDTTDLSSLRIVASSGSALPVPTVVEWLDRVGPNLYNLYGSTEVGQATLAAPDDLVAHPGTAGRAMPGCSVRILDEFGAEVPTGETGRIFVGNGAQFEGYTGGGGKEIVDGIMSSGDVGYLDADGLLFVTGRADDMIVSGGENVFPQEIEDLLLDDERIADVALVGVDDDEFGQRLAAHVVIAPGARLSAAAVRTLVSDNLARHKVPRDVVFVDELPRTTTGKIRRNQL